MAKILGVHVPFTKSELKAIPTPPQEPGSPNGVVPPGRVSVMDLPNLYSDIQAELKVLKPLDYVEMAATVRKAYPYIQNLSLAISDLVQLTNTGHQVYFDPGVPPDQVNKMRQDILDSGKEWMDGGAGINSLINKMTSQIYVGGAISTEWVPNNELTGIEQTAFINPEDIRFIYNKSRGRFSPYQLIRHSAWPVMAAGNEKIELNPMTYRYFGMGGDSADPHGIPPFVAALEDLGVQRDMVKNIQFIVRQVGLMGFIELILAKPEQQKDESESKYTTRLTNLLTESKKNIAAGTKDGVLVGYKDDHEYEFHSTTSNIGGLADVFGISQTLVAAGLKYSTSFMGGGGTGSEANITIIFTKMLSQLKNVQDLVKSNLEFGYALHCRLRGFKFKNLTVEFNPSTITDDLKMQQAMEYKIRNYRVLYADGIINLQGYAEAFNYEKPDQKEPRAPIDPDGTLAKAAAEAKRSADNNTADRKIRDKKKDQPKSRAQDTRPQ
jgi:hypothetical protein